MNIISNIAASIFFLFFAAIGVAAFQDNNYAFTIILILIGLIPGVLIWLERKRVLASEDFPKWINENRKKIKQGTASYKGIRVNTETELVRYRACVAIVIVTFSFTSAWQFPGQKRSIQTLYSLITLLMGWWGIPWGPIYTVQFLYKNIRGGEVIKLGNLL